MTQDFPGAVLFDLDGTLVDTAPDLTHALNWVLAQENCAPVSLDEVRHMVGKGARHLMRQALQAAGLPPTDEKLDALLPVFLDHYGAHIADDSRLFPGVRDVVEELAAAGVKLAVCTNKPEKLSRDLLGALGVDGLFPTIVGGDSLDRRKPDPEHIFETLRRMGASAKDAVMVGDSINDIAAARDAGVPVIAVTFGYTDTPVVELGADLVIEDFAELVPALRRLNGRV